MNRREEDGAGISHRTSMGKKGTKAFAFERYSGMIPNYKDFLDSLRQDLPVSIRVNTLKISVESFRHLMLERGYDLKTVPGMDEAFLLQGAAAPGATLEYALGYYHIQGLSSMLPARALSAQPGEVILDLCAAPGGKATHVAQLLENRGLLVANDVKPHRLNILRSHIARLGTTSLLVTRYYGQNFPLRMTFDRILLDPPCSAEGTYRVPSPPPLTENPNAFAPLTRIQRSLLGRALDILKPGGTLVYSTCTYAPEENEAVIHEMVESGRGEILSLSLPFPCTPGLTSWEGRSFHPDLAKAARIYPHQLNSWGFFLACLRKRN
jgi:NOL1/NOP2/sun family putative RNA methylase